MGELSTGMGKLSTGKTVNFSEHVLGGLSIRKKKIYQRYDHNKQNSSTDLLKLVQNLETIGVLLAHMMLFETTKVATLSSCLEIGCLFNSKII